MLVVAKQVWKNRKYCLLDDRGTECVARDAPLPDQVSSDSRKLLLDAVQRVGFSKTTQHMPRVQREEDDRRCPPIEQRVRVVERLRVLPVITLPGGDPKATPKATYADSRQQMIDG